MYGLVALGSILESISITPVLRENRLPYLRRSPRAGRDELELQSGPLPW